MAQPSKSIPQVATSWHEPALPAFSALCDEAVRRCSTQYGLPVTLSDEVRLRAWQLCWLALDAASAPANNIPDTGDAQALPHALVEQLRAAALPKLNTQTWQELRRARDQQLFAALPPETAASADLATHEALAEMLKDGFARVDLVKLHARVTPSVAAAITRWLSACLLALDAQALADDSTDVSALELAVFVQVTLQREHGAAAAVEDLSQSEPERPAAASDVRAEPALLVEPPATADATPRAAAASSSTSELTAGPSEPEAAVAIQQRPSTSERDASRTDAPQVAAHPRRFGPRAVAVAGVVAMAAVLMLMLRGGSAPEPNADTSVSVREPAPHIVTPKAPVAAEPDTIQNTVAEPTAKPQRSLSELKSAASHRPRFRNLATAKRAHTAKKIDDAAYAAAIAELEALRSAKIEKEQLDLQSGKLKQADYQRKVDTINRNLGFDRR